MPLRVAVVSDALSPDAIFPYWHRYYGDQFGVANLYVVTYADYGTQFRGIPLGGLIQLPVGYEDSARRKFISRFVTALLDCYEAVIRVDIDEFLVVDPRSAPSLAAYVEQMKCPYMTARGFDVIQLETEPGLPKDTHASLLENRQYAYPNTALNKTCIVKVPVYWSVGFHWSSVYPKFGPLFMLHTKRIDIQWQIDWAAKMFDGIKDNPAVSSQIKDYYSPKRESVLKYHSDVGSRPRLSGVDSWYRNDLTSSYLNTIQFNPGDGIYFGEYGHGHVLCEILPEWRRLL
jgi:hypothetical protein